jgi:hypothetical protein
LLDTQGCCRGNRIVDHLVADGRSLGGPLLGCHRSIADDVLAEDMLDVLNIAPVLGITVLQPNKRSGDVGRAVLGVVNNNGLFAPGRHEDLDRFVVIAVGALVERALNAVVAATEMGARSLFGSAQTISSKGGY